MATVVEAFYGEFVAIVQLLDRYGAVSFRNTVNDNFRKTLLLCAASHFEHRITSDVISFCSEVTKGNSLIPALVKSRAVARQYHTWFSWNANNANAFFASFGDEFRDYMVKRVENNDELARSIRDFMEIGRDRNRLVHQDFGNFTLEKTAEEIFALYASAIVFVELIPKLLREYSSSTARADESSP